MDILELLPQFFWLGPPLPRFLNIFWPWAEQGAEAPAPPQANVPVTQPAATGSTTYDNIEAIEFPEGFDPDTFMPKKIIIHRKATLTPLPSS